MAGVRAAWQRDGEVFAEVCLHGELAGDARAFGLHPVLLNTALAAADLAADGPEPEPGMIRMPFAYTGIRLHAAGAGALRARLRRGPDGAVSLTAADDRGLLVIPVDAVVSRAVPAAPAGADTGEGLYGVDWVPVPPGPPGPALSVAVIGPDQLGLAQGLASAGITARAYPDLAGLAAAGGDAVPDLVLAAATTPRPGTTRRGTTPGTGTPRTPGTARTTGGWRGRRGCWRGGCWCWCRSGWLRTGWPRRGW
jgi:hypothetical protein